MSRRDLGRAVLNARFGLRQAELIGAQTVGQLLIELARSALLGENPKGLQYDPGGPWWKAEVAEALLSAGVLDDNSSPERIDFVLNCAWDEILAGLGPEKKAPIHWKLESSNNRGLCVDCGRWIALQGSNRMRHHGPPARPCPGSGRFAG